MSYRVVKPATHEEWLEERKKGIGSSEAGTIMGVNHFDTPYKLWRRKTGLDNTVKTGEQLELGHHLEPAVASLFEARTGFEIQKSSEGDWLAVDTKREYLRVSPDRIYFKPGEKHVRSNQHILECKTSSISIDKDDIPPYWYCQIQYQMGIMGVKSGALAWITSFPRLHFDFIEVEFNPSFFKSLIDVLDKFWNVNILQNVAPDDIDGDDALVRNPEAQEGLVMEADEETIEVYNNLKMVINSISELEKTKAELEGEIKSTMAEAESLVMPSGTVMAKWANTKPSARFNAKKFQTTDPDGYMQYVEILPGTRRFTLK